MKYFLFLGTIFMLTVSADKCGAKGETSTKYKARLETKALCMNYTFSIVEGDIDTSLVVSNWTDENTGKSFTKAFGIGNPCNFPKEIEQGDEFYFTIDTARQAPCAVCMAYYPTPQKKLSIKVIGK